MKRKSGRAGKKKYTEKKTAKHNVKRILLVSSIALGVCMIIALTLFLAQPRLLWYVDEDLTASWNRILRESPPPYSRYEILPRVGNTPFPQGRFGFIISRNGPEGELITGAPVMM